jgi:hypothetical protein
MARADVPVPDIDADLIAQLERDSRPKRSGCTVAAALNALDDRTSATLTLLIARTDITHAALARAIDDRGHRMTGETIRRHRAGICTCE